MKLKQINRNRYKRTPKSIYTNYKKYIFGGIIIIILFLIIFLSIYLTIGNKSNSSSNSNIQQPTYVPTTTALPTPPAPPTTTAPPAPPAPLPTGKIIGAWSSTIGCGDGAFNIISLASALPQDYSPNGLTTFFSKIEGNYDSKLSDGKTKYIISVGGSNATAQGWPDFLSTIIINKNASTFYDACKCRGIVGIDFDLEQTTKAIIPDIINLVNQFKNIDNNFIVMYTILLGSPTTYADLLKTSNYDYLSLMLYNGGMYDALGSGAGCDWDGWAELILSKGTAGCKYPGNAGCITNLQPDCSDVQSAFATTANLSDVDPSKVLLGLIIDTTGTKLDSKILARANQLITQYSAAGMMIWVLPGWANTKSIDELNTMGFNIDTSKCSSGGSNCPVAQNPCSNNMTEKCVASACGKSKQGETDLNCNPCGTGQTYWPCNQIGFCEAASDTPQQTCL